MAILVNTSNVLGFVMGGIRDKIAMKKRVKMGYEAACTDHVTRYDQCGLQHYTKLANEMLKDVDVCNC